MTVSRLMLIHAETPLHPGTGSALGTVDLPVARERHTHWPLIPGSSIKGVLRDRCTRKDKDAVFEVFGPDTKNASDHAGALAITDARILAFPVRSLCGLFAWTTCPAVLMRLARDLKMCGDKALADLAAKLSKDLANKTALISSDKLTTSSSTKEMVLEEFDYAAEISPDVAALGKWVDEMLGQGTRLSTHLALISDEAFAHYTRFATEVTARIAIDSDTKTVQDQALFYEEFIPAGAIFYSLLLASPSLKKGASLNGADAVLKVVADSLGAPPIVQLGGNATTGKGLCHLVIAGGK